MDAACSQCPVLPHAGARANRPRSATMCRSPSGPIPSGIRSVVCRRDPPSAHGRRHRGGSNRAGLTALCVQSGPRRTGQLAETERGDRRVHVHAGGSGPHLIGQTRAIHARRGMAVGWDRDAADVSRGRSQSGVQWPAAGPTNAGRPRRRRQERRAAFSRSDGWEPPPHARSDDDSRLIRGLSWKCRISYGQMPDRTGIAAGT